MTLPSDSPSRANGAIDMHVHLVGNGSRGSGCELRLKGHRQLLSAFMERAIGLPSGSLNGDLDAVYTRHLVQLVRKSSLAGACVFAQDDPHDARGMRMAHRGTFYVPNEWVFRVCRKDPRLLPVVSIHPARRDALDELERCLEAGAVMLKLLPNCHNVDCSDARYRPFWKRMADAGLPLIAHVGGENTLQVIDRRQEDPRRLRLPLECGVVTIAAHCAGRARIADPCYYDVLRGMIREHDNLYTDNSALNSPVRSALLRRVLRDDLVLPRLVHGSDYPVPISGAWAWLRRVVGLDACLAAARIPNVLERDVFLKRAMGFPDEVFTRGWKLLRRV